MKSIFIAAVFLFVLATYMSSSALAKDIHDEESNIQQFIGLWETIDPDDGSHLILSITSNEDGKVKLLNFDTFWTLCNGGRGLIQGTGEIEGRHSLKVDDIALTCFNDVPPRDLPPITLILNRDGTLFEEGASPLPALTYHRTSK